MPLRNKSGTAVCGFSKRIWGFRCSVSQGTHCRHFLSSLCLVCLSVHCCYGNVYSQSHHTFSRSQTHQNNVSEPHLDNTHPAIHTQRLTMLVHAKPMSNVDLHIKCISRENQRNSPTHFIRRGSTQFLGSSLFLWTWCHTISLSSGKNNSFLRPRTKCIPFYCQVVKTSTIR